MSTFELEDGDPGTALLSSQSVKDQGAWLPEGTDPVWGDVRHHRERIDQLKEWVRYWKARADTSAAREARVRAALLQGGQSAEIRWRNALIEIDR